jgi:hypothetical protein
MEKHSIWTNCILVATVERIDTYFIKLFADLLCLTKQKIGRLKVKLIAK